MCQPRKACAAVVFELGQLQTRCDLSVAVALVVGYCPLCCGKETFRGGDVALPLDLLVFARRARLVFDHAALVGEVLFNIGLPFVKQVLAYHHTAVGLQLSLGYVAVTVVVIGNTVGLAVAVSPPIHDVGGHVGLKRGRPFFRKGVDVVHIALLRKRGQPTGVACGKGDYVGHLFACYNGTEFLTVVGYRRVEANGNTRVFLNLFGNGVNARGRVPCGHVDVPVNCNVCAVLDVFPTVFVRRRVGKVGIGKFRHVVIAFVGNVASVGSAGNKRNKHKHSHNHSRQTHKCRFCHKILLTYEFFADTSGHFAYGFGSVGESDSVL